MVKRARKKRNDKERKGLERGRWKRTLKRTALPFSVVAIIFFAGFVLLKSDAVRVKKVVITGAHRLNEREILKVLNLPDHPFMLSLNYDDMRMRLLRQAWIRDAQVRAVLPSTIVVNITEQVPVAIYRKTGRYYLINSEGVPFAEGRVTSLPEIMGASPERLPEAVHLLRLVITTGALKVKSIMWSKTGIELELVSPEGLRVIFPPSKEMWTKKLRYLLAVLSKLKELPGKVDVIDLRGEKTGVLKLRGGEAHE